MTSVEKGAAGVAVLVFIFGVGAGWNGLNNRIDRVDDKIGAIQKTLGSTPCSAILTRQLAAIDKGRSDVRKSLDDLSSQYKCLSSRNDWAPVAAVTVTSPTMNIAEASRFGSELNAVDFQLNKKSKK